MKKEKLEILLRNVQEMKSDDEGLVGTKEIYELIRNRETIEDRPLEVSNKINAELKINYGNPTYLASPERILGLTSYLSIIEYGFVDSDSLILFEKFMKKEHINEIITLPKYIGKALNSDLFNGLNELRDRLGDYEKNAEEIKDYLVQFFSKANLENITSDDEFGYIISKLFNEEYSKIKEKIPNNLKDIISDYIEILSSDILDTNWEEQLSKNKFLESQNEENIIINEKTFQIANMTKRIITDRVEHRLEYRRRLLSHVLKDFYDNGKIRYLILKRLLGYKSIFNQDRDLVLSGETPINSWENLVSYYDLIIKSNKSDIEELRNKSNNSERRSLILIKGSLDKAIKHLEESIEHNILIRRFLGQDKNWVERMLRN